jgi:hypothetical protein
MPTQNQQQKLQENEATKRPGFLRRNAKRIVVGALLLGAAVVGGKYIYAKKNSTAEAEF